MTIDRNNLDTIQGLRSAAAYIVKQDRRGTGGIAVNDQLIRYRTVVTQYGIKRQRAAIANVVAVNNGGIAGAFVRHGQATGVSERTDLVKRGGLHAVTGSAAGSHQDTRVNKGVSTCTEVARVA